MENNFGFLKVAVASNKIEVANPEFNGQTILEQMNVAKQNGASILVLPELCLTGYTCGDLFYQDTLINSALEALQKLLEATSENDVLTFLGMPLRKGYKLYNVAVAIFKGQILAVVPKKHIPNTNEFYERRWFNSGERGELDLVNICGQEVDFGDVVISVPDHGVKIGVDICEDLWAPIPPSCYYALNGAQVIVNLSASNELVTKSDYRKQLIQQQSARCICAYLYSNASCFESSTDVVFSGDSYIFENGIMLNTSESFKRDSQIIFADVDIPRLDNERIKTAGFYDSQVEDLPNEYILDEVLNQSENFEREVYPFPFIPRDKENRDRHCEEIFNIQVSGLCKRLEHTNSKNVYVGVSGGLDSTLAILVTKRAFELLNLPLDGIIGITMPGFGTTDRTYENAMSIMRGLGVTIKEIDIKNSCLLHFEDIGHDKNEYDVTYENVQARERTQVLMDMANKYGGFVIGTGDLSELALGWCTYNGDHMSMYSVNASIPKTLIKYLIDWVADNHESEELSKALKDVLDTPISPELLPPDSDGKIAQHTESAIGPYELHDFFLYYSIRHSMEPEKVLFLAKRAFENKYDEQTITKWLVVFYKRFFAQQFKRSCLPDGPKVGSVSLSPRGDWRMPSDASVNAWLKRIEK